MKSASIHAGILCIAFAAACANAEVTPASTAPPGMGSHSVAIVEQMRRNDFPGAIPQSPEPALNLEALKMRLRETGAIGVFTKLALRNQLDDLLQQVRSHHLGGQKADVARLRPLYDQLVLKVLTLIRDGDPPLARTISASREAIWTILADPEQFAAVSGIGA